MTSRKALHAGSWYTEKGTELNKQLEKWLSKADSIHTPACALIAPHAGYAYSGPCAGHAYKQVDPSKVRRVFIIGPSHHFYLPKCALSSLTHYETPLYDLKIDQQIYTELKETGQFDLMTQEVDEAEHSIEMHLPYIAKVMERRRGQYTIVPILIGALKTKGEVEYGKLLSKYLLDPDNLFVISSDFCHWGKRFSFTYHNTTDGPIHSSIEKLDRMGIDRILALDCRGFSEYLKETGNTICGRHPIAVLLNMVDSLCGAHPGLNFSPRLIQYEQSSQCKALSDSSVSYAAVSLTLHHDQ